MSADGFTGPVFAVVPEPLEVIWQYGFRTADGEVVALWFPPRDMPTQVLCRRLMPVEDWKPVEEVRDVDL